MGLRISIYECEYYEWHLTACMVHEQRCKCQCISYVWDRFGYIYQSDFIIPYSKLHGVQNETKPVSS